MDTDMDGFQGSINVRQRELHNVADILAESADRARRRSAASKVLIVVLGAIAATSGTATQLVGGDSTLVIVLYAAVGVTISAIAGLEAAFKFGERAAELTVLAATCQSTLRETDSRWQKDVRPAMDNRRLEAAQVVLDLQDQRLTEVQEKAARLGVNIALEIRELKDDSYNA